MAVPGILVDHRLIADGDELALLPEEMAAFAGSVLKVRRASGAARIVAREVVVAFRTSAARHSEVDRRHAGLAGWNRRIVGARCRSCGRGDGGAA